MTSLADRLRDVVRPRGSGAPAAVQAGAAPVPVHDESNAADVLGGEWYESAGQRFLVVDRKYVPGYRHGRMVLADCLPPANGAWPRLNLLTSGAGALGKWDDSQQTGQQKLLFVDLETTGLAGGAGTYAFLVGCGWFDGGVFRLRQFFLSEFGAERALLESVAELAADAACVITYNGKAFDLPVMETRFVLQRMQTPFAELPHVDMLHPARRLWRDDDVECRLTNLERFLCGHEREGDVPGFEIPSRYFRYVRTGDARPLEAVLEHNRLDVISLAMLTARAAQLLDSGPQAAATPREAYGMGRIYERAGMTGEALDSFSRAAGIERSEFQRFAQADGDTTRAEALRAFAVLCRRFRRYAQAADAWRRLLEMRSCPPALAREASEALAVHHEHRARDLETARTFALRSLPFQSTAARQEALRYRLARLDRKIGSQQIPVGNVRQSLFPLTS